MMSSNDDNSDAVGKPLNRDDEGDEKPVDVPTRTGRPPRFRDRLHGRKSVEMIERNEDLKPKPSDEIDMSSSHDRNANNNISKMNDSMNKSNTGSDSKDLLNMNVNFRTDPVKTAQVRQRSRIDRLTTTNMPEIHIIGHLISGRKIIETVWEGACCRWKIDYGKAWQHLGGETMGQTQVGYPKNHIMEAIPFNHPIDVHFGEIGLQGWGAPRISCQTYRMDSFGQLILVGYGFVHLPASPGYHKVEVNMWRPIGPPNQEIESMMLGKIPSLVSHEPLYESAWRERCRLVTLPAGTITFEFYVITRLLKSHSVDKS